LHNNADDSSESELDDNSIEENKSKSSTSDVNDSESFFDRRDNSQQKNYEKQIDLSNKDSSKFTNDFKEKMNFMEFDVDQKLTQFNNKISLNDFDYLLTNKNNKNEIYIGDNNNNIDLSYNIKAIDDKNFDGEFIELVDKKTEEKNKSNLFNQLGETYFILSNYDIEQIKCCKDNCLSKKGSNICENRRNRTSILNHIQLNSN